MAMTVMNAVEELQDCTSLLNSPLELRRFADEEGYLFFRGLLPRQDVLDVRREILQIAKKHGWLQPGTDLMDGIVRLDILPIEGTDLWRPLYVDLQKNRAFHALASHKQMLNPMSILFDRPALAHARNIARLMYPGTGKFTTPAHQDFFYIHGTPNTWTGWTPIGDCPADLGGVAVATRSHKSGLLPTRPAVGAGGNGVDLPESALWRTAEYQAGDVVFFHSYLVHQSQDNDTRDRVRLSVDYRYQSPDELINPASMMPHVGVITWEEIYQSWGTDENDPLKYYWTKMDLKYETAGRR